LDVRQRFEREAQEHVGVVRASVDSLGERLEAVTRLCRESLRAGNKLMFFGNGGSAADAQHFATELVVRYRVNRKALAAIALTTDTSGLTACANDFGFDQVFARQIEALGRAGDVAIGISTSGRSPNVTLAFRKAREIGIKTVALTGGDGGELVGLVDEILVVPSQVTARIQEVHLLIGHTLCDALESESVEEVER
jgi:D-sedoheptulose 7-phosphate isomerase